MTIAARREGNPLGEIATRHILEDFLAILRGKKPEVLGGREEAGERELYVVEEMRNIFSKARKGFDHNKKRKHEFFLFAGSDEATAFAFAKHFSEYWGEGKAERIIRVLEQGLEKYQEAMASYRTREVIFPSTSTKKEAIQAIAELYRLANVNLYMLPTYPERAVERHGPCF